MKKFFIILILSFIPFFLNAQIYTSIKYLDKFDDEIKIEKNIKTIVEKTDSTFIVETKGKTPKVYFILNYAKYNSAGDKDNIVNLINDIYGYQESWRVIRNEDKDDYIKACAEYVDKIKSGEETSNLLDEIAKYWLFVVHRVVTTQYTHTYESEYFWIEDEVNTKLGKDVNRIIYIKN